MHHATIAGQFVFEKTLIDSYSAFTPTNRYTPASTQYLGSLKIVGQQWP